ncbi:MAG: glutaredoxin family protein [Chloroflexi bacterium]|nr:glutaredoxin family protein [Chloroflexota bacterium]
MKAGCHLCEDAEAELDRLQARYPHVLERIDINACADLTRRYGERIPVMVVHGREYAAPLHRTIIETALKEAAAHQSDSRSGLRASTSNGPSSPGVK